MAKTNEGLVKSKHLNKGFEFNDREKKINVAVDGTTVTYTPEGKLQATSSGSNVNFNNLPTVSWKKGTKVLAVQDGNNVFMQASEDIFTDVVLSLTTAKNSVNVVTGNNEVVNLVAQVTNAGVNPAGNIRLVISKPQLGTYSLGTPQLESQGATNFVKVSGTEYTIESLASGGVAKVTIPVTYSKRGSFTFGGQVTSIVDTNTSNNSKTVTISVTERASETGGSYVPTQDCPLFTIRDTRYNKSLRTTGIVNLDYSSTSSSIDENIKAGIYNIYSDMASLSNRSFNLKNVAQIRCFSLGKDDMPLGDVATHVVVPNYITTASFSKKRNLVIPPTSRFSVTGSNFYLFDGIEIGTDKYTFNSNTGELTFRNVFTLNASERRSETNVNVLCLMVKPKGSNCNWQVCIIKLGMGLTIGDYARVNKITHNSRLGSAVIFNYTNEDPPTTLTPTLEIASNWVNSPPPDDLVTYRYVHSIGYYLRNYTTRTLTTNKKVEVVIKKGTNGTFTLSSPDANYLANIHTRGNISTEYNASNKTLTVTLNNPQPQNSIKLGVVEFKVID